MAYPTRLSEEKEQEIINYWRTHIENKSAQVAEATGVTSLQVEKCLDRYIKTLKHGFRT